MNVIECKNLSLAYERKTVIDGLSMQVERGSYLCIIGENGAGKSTLVKAILQLKKQRHGSIEFKDGLSLNDIGYLPQQTDVQKDFPASVYEIVLSGCLNKLGFRFFYGKKEKELAKRYMKMLGIDSLAGSAYNELSGGQQQRVLLARALCSGAELLVLDEPVSGLDPVMTNELYDIIEKLNREHGLTVIMVSHDVTPIMRYATHVLHLGGNNAYFAPIEEYKQSEIAQTFLRKEALSL